MKKPKSYPYLVENYVKYVNLIFSYKLNGVLDLSDENWLSPSNILLLKNVISEANKKGGYKPPKNEKVKGYLDYITLKRNSVDVVGGETYIPFSRITDSNADSIASKVTGMIGNNLNNDSLQVLKYCIDELLANITEHSQYHNSFIMLQNYPKMNELEFSLMDDGISIPGNFRKYMISFDNDCDSLNMALNGISTKDKNGERGFGLHSVFELLTKGMKGDGVLISGRGILNKRFIW